MNEEVKISNQQKSVKNIGLWNNEVWAKSDFMHFNLEVKGDLISDISDSKPFFEFVWNKVEDNYRG